MNKKLNYKSLLMQVMGIFVARVTLGSFNPFAISFIAAMYLDESKNVFTMLCVIFGMITVLPEVTVVKYFAIMIIILVVAALIKKKNKKVTIFELAIIAGASTSMINFASSIFYVSMRAALLLSFAEGIAVFAFTIVFRKGVEAVISNKKAESFSNEGMVSLAVLLSLVIYGLPEVSETSTAISAFASVFSVLFIGYKYGAGYGAIVGTTCGLTMSVLSGNFNFLGIFCMLGILTGTFREFGKLAVTLLYLIATIVLFSLIDGTGLDIDLIKYSAIPTGVNSVNLVFNNLIRQGIVPLISASGLFLVLPESITYKIYNKKKDKKESFSNKTIQILTREKLNEFSDSFHNLANTLKGVSTTKINLSDYDKDMIYNELTETQCKECEKCSICWEDNSSYTYDGIGHIMEVVEIYGTITVNQVPASFRARCIKLERFILETIKLFDMAKLNISCNNKLLESKEAIAEQFSQIGFIIEDFSNGIYKSTPSTKESEDEIISALGTNYISVTNIAIFEKRNHKKEILIYANTQGDNCVTTKEISQVISKILDKNIIPSKKSKTVIKKTSDIYIFEEDSNYNVLTGVSKMTKEGSTVSGDNYSFIRPDSGTAVLTLSDGMGTGEKAYKESEAVINLLEQFIEVGFSIESAIKLINSVMLIRSSEDQIYSTVDMTVINLYTGMCDLIKLGASTTFIKRNDDVEIIQSSSLPIGMINQMDYEVYSKKLSDGDFVIMVTDGVIECIDGDEKEKTMSDFIATIKMNNPKEVANAVLNYSLEINNWTPKDDMTVLVGGFWRKL